MYLWKCWRDSWMRFLLCALMTCITVGAVAVGHALLFNEGGMHLVRYTDPHSTAVLWHDMGDAVGSLLFMLQLSAFFLGSVGVGEEHSTHTLEFLLTRPRSRWHFIRTAWLLGLAELTGVAIVAFAGAMAVLLYSTGRVDNWRLLLATVPLVLVPALLTYSLTYLLTTTFKNGRTALFVALALVIAYVECIRRMYRVCVQGADCFVKNWNPASVLRYLFDPSLTFPVIAVLFWVGVAVAMLWPAKKIFERQEI